MSWRNHRLIQVKDERCSDSARDLLWIDRRELLSLAFMVVADPLPTVALQRLVHLIPPIFATRRSLRAQRLKLHQSRERQCRS